MDGLLDSAILPVNTVHPDQNRTTRLQTPGSAYAINDRNTLARVFESEPGATFLDFSLDEVLQLAPFLQALNVQDKYLSSIYDEETACEDDGVVDNSLTKAFKERAYDLLR